MQFWSETSRILSHFIVKFDVGPWGSRTKVVDQRSLDRETLLHICWTFNAQCRHCPRNRHLRSRTYFTHTLKIMLFPTLSSYKTDKKTVHYKQLVTAINLMAESFPINIIALLVFSAVTTECTKKLKMQVLDSISSVGLPC